MSSKGSIETTILIAEAEGRNKEKADALGARKDVDVWEQLNIDDKATRSFVIWTDDASWLENEVAHVAEVLGDAGFAPSDWIADIRYVSYEDPHTDGEVVNLHIENGSITDMEESRIEMVKTEPYPHVARSLEKAIEKTAAKEDGGRAPAVPARPAPVADTPQLGR